MHIHHESSLAGFTNLFFVGFSGCLLFISSFLCLSLLLLLLAFFLFFLLLLLFSQCLALVLLILLRFSILAVFFLVFLVFLSFLRLWGFLRMQGLGSHHIFSSQIKLNAELVASYLSWCYRQKWKKNRAYDGYMTMTSEISFPPTLLRLHIILTAFIRVIITGTLFVFFPFGLWVIRIFVINSCHARREQSALFGCFRLRVPHQIENQILELVGKTSGSNGWVGGY